MTGKLLKIIEAKYPLSVLDIGEMSNLKANGMKFTVSAYLAEGLGHVSVMRAKGFFGLMKMDTLIINPTCIDLPLYSYDRIYAAGNDTLIVELYDTMIGEYSGSAQDAINLQYTDLPDRDPGEHWYDSIKLAQSISKKSKFKLSSRMDELTAEHFKAYLDVAAEKTDENIKKEKASVYVEGLLQNGGPSTDVFKKAMGEEKTALLFRNILFGTI